MNKEEKTLIGFMENRFADLRHLLLVVWVHSILTKSNTNELINATASQITALLISLTELFSIDLNDLISQITTNASDQAKVDSLMNCIFRELNSALGKNYEQNGFAQTMMNFGLSAEQISKLNLQGLYFGRKT